MSSSGDRRARFASAGVASDRPASSHWRAHVGGDSRDASKASDSVAEAGGFERPSNMPLHLTAPGPARACPSRAGLFDDARVPQVSGKTLIWLFSVKWAELSWPHGV
jgi:hypothetical protein